MAALLLALQAAALLWASTARIPIYASAPARLEIAGGPQKLTSDVTGRVLESRLVLGRKVEAGEPLIRFDARDQELSLARALAHQQTLSKQAPPLESELKNGELSLASARQGLTSSLAQAQAQADEAEAKERLSRGELQARQQLFDGGHIGELELQQFTSQLAQRTAAAEAARKSRDRLRAEGNAQLSGREEALAELRKDRAELAGQLEEANAAAAQAQRELEKRTIRAETAGHLAEIAEVRQGEQLTAGQSLATLVPEGRLRVVASFEPWAAIGRVQPGQPGRVRFDGFPWMQYGSLPVRVESVAREPRAERLRVELVPQTLATAIPLQHGLRGNAEVEIERVTPLQLVLRIAGETIAPRPQPIGEPGETLTGAR